MISGETLLFYINLEKMPEGLSNVTVRGVSPQINYIRPNVKLLEGRMFNFGMRELILGESISKRFKNSQIGSSVRFAGLNWKIVGKFTSEGSGFDSEMWGDAIQLLNAFNRANQVSTLSSKLDDANNFEKFNSPFSADRRLQQYEPKIEQNFLKNNPKVMAIFINIGNFYNCDFQFWCYNWGNYNNVCSSSQPNCRNWNIKVTWLQSYQHSNFIFI